MANLSPVVNAFDRATQAKHDGAVFGGTCEDLDFTLVRWSEGCGVEEHTNDEVDVLMVVLQGQGELILNGLVHPIAPGSIALVPKEAARSLRCTQGELLIQNVHKHRRRLMPVSMPRKA